ncbi:DEAD/DEAH box helicase family protein [Microbacterium galbinum]|uniref:ATP-binding protein n=1 Tax=Microbacterium galbinum TaxID=2851646 RepID=A0ABY4IUV4_9MICO|nr:AAA family ATPase [Microbacterium galbinum]UPL15581.1 ATP-binding protein [Microbacterium galbinum]
MRIVVSGTHASGKSTLIADFLGLHPGFDHLPDPFEVLGEGQDDPGPASFLAQLTISARRLVALRADEHVIAERGPLDFLAYLRAWEDLGRGSVPAEVLGRAEAVSADAMRDVDVVATLPLNAHDRIWVHDEEDPALRSAMDAALLEIYDDRDLRGDRATVIELAGDREARLTALAAAVGSLYTASGLG